MYYSFLAVFKCYIGGMEKDYEPCRTKLVPVWGVTPDNSVPIYKLDPFFFLFFNLLFLPAYSGVSVLNWEKSNLM